MKKKSHVKSIPCPMGPVLFLDSREPYEVAVVKIKAIRKFIAQRIRFLESKVSFHDDELHDLFQLAASTKEYCKDFQKKSPEDEYDDEENDENEENEVSEEVRNLQSLCSAPFRYNKIDTSKMIEDTLFSTFVGPYKVTAPYETRASIYQLIQDMERCLAEMKPAMVKSDPYRALKQTGWDAYTFKNMYAHMVPYLTSVVEHRVFAPKDLYDPKKAVDLRKLEQVYELIQRYIPILLRKKGVAKENIESVWKDIGFFEPYAPPKGAARRLKSAAYSAPSSPVKSQSPQKKRSSSK